MVQSGIRPGRDSNLRPLYRAIVALSLCLTVQAQGAESITCPTLFLTSPTGASPCLSLFRVMNICTDRPPVIPLITQLPLGMYGPPNGTAIEIECQCTDVVYNLFSACAACQNGEKWYSHDAWFQACPPNRQNITIISPEIMNWNNRTYLPTFDVEVALAIEGNLPIPEPSISTTTVSLVTPSVTLTAASTKSTGTNLGAIIGGAVGGALFIAIVGFLIFCIRKRKSRRVPPSAEFMKYAQSQGINNATVPLTNMSQEDDPRSSQSHGYAPARSSILYLNANSSTRSPSALGVSRNNTDEGDAPPAFTTGLFKDPIFEKGVALNLAGASAASGGPASASPTGHGPNPLTQTPIAYSPSSTMFHPDNQRLIHERQMSS